MLPVLLLFLLLSSHALCSPIITTAASNSSAQSLNELTTQNQRLHSLAYMIVASIEYENHARANLNNSSGAVSYTHLDVYKRRVIIQEMYRKHLCLNLPSSSQPPTVLHRMENDRERHKKSKEHNWFIDREHMLDTTEFDNLWKTFATGMNRNDYQNIKNIQEIAHTSYIYLEQWYNFYKLQQQFHFRQTAILKWVFLSNIYWCIQSTSLI